VTVSLQPIPNDASQAVIRIDSGRFTAPSVRLPSGLETGPNTFTFGPASQSEGILNLLTGEYTATATAAIVNTLFPQGLSVRGGYSGVFNAATGRTTMQSQSADSIKVDDRLLFTWSEEVLRLTWTRGLLEESTSLGSWTAIPNAASPYRVDTTRNQQQFFRLRLSGP
jgi:hypothetical protein